MDKVLFFANIPILLQRCYNNIINYLSYLIVALLVLHYLKFCFLLLGHHLFLFGLQNSFVFWSHFNKVANTLPHETVVLWLECGVEVVRLGLHESTAINYIFFLLVDVLELFGVVADLE